MLYILYIVFLQESKLENRKHIKKIIKKEEIHLQYLVKKNWQVSGPTKLKLVLVKGQLCLINDTMGTYVYSL